MMTMTSVLQSPTLSPGAMRLSYNCILYTHPPSAYLSCTFSPVYQVKPPSLLLSVSFFFSFPAFSSFFVCFIDRFTADGQVLSPNRVLDVLPANLPSVSNGALLSQLVRQCLTMCLQTLSLAYHLLITYLYFVLVGVLEGVRVSKCSV